MNVTKSAIPDVLVIEPTVYGDARGFFFESFNQREWQAKSGLDTIFVQDNHSRSVRGVLRGIHYQIRQPQGKLVRVIAGAVLDVAVDLRRNSATFGKWVGEYLSGENKKQLWIPEGFGHGFVVLSEFAEFLYRTTDYWAPEHERCIIWNDKDINVDWGIKFAPILSAKDVEGTTFREAEVYD